MTQQLMFALIGIGGVLLLGILVLVALLLIFFYLLYVVKPIFESARITQEAEISLPVCRSST